MYVSASGLFFVPYWFSPFLYSLVQPSCSMVSCKSSSSTLINAAFSISGVTKFFLFSSKSLKIFLSLLFSDLILCSFVFSVFVAIPFTPLSSPAPHHTPYTTYAHARRVILGYPPRYFPPLIIFLNRGDYAPVCVKTIPQLWRSLMMLFIMAVLA